MEAEWAGELLGGSADAGYWAFEQLYKAYVPQLVVFARRFVGSTHHAQDIVQETFYNIWRGRASIRLRGTIRSYLYRAVMNRAFDARAKDKVRARCSEQFSALGASPAMGQLHTDPAENFQRRAVRRAFALACTTLTDRQRRVAELRFADALTREEISEVLGIAESTVKNLLTTALAKFRAGVRAEYR